MRVPLGAPTVAVEIFSPDDRLVELDDKITVYLRAGCALVVVVDPRAELIALYAVATRGLRAGERLEDPALPGFTLDVGALFARAARGTEQPKRRMGDGTIRPAARYGRAASVRLVRRGYRRVALVVRGALLGCD